MNIHQCEPETTRPSAGGRASWKLCSLMAFAGAIFGALTFVSSTKENKLYAGLGIYGPGVDTDHEGLADAIELQLGSSPLFQDTDGDGVNDLIEAIFGTSPTNPLSVPSCAAMETPIAKILSYVEGDNFHLVVSVSVPDGDVNSISNAGAILFAPEVAGYSGPQIADLNPLVLSGSIQSVATAPNKVTRIYSSDSSFPKTLINSLMGSDGYAQFTIAFSATIAGITVSDINYFTTTAIYDSTMSSLASLQLSPQNPGSGAFKPLQPVALPPDWTPDSACYVQSATIGVEFGAILVLQGVSADCVEQQGTVCNPVACAEMVGRIFRVVDPCALGICQ